MKRPYLYGGLIVALFSASFNFAGAQSDVLKSALQGVTESASQISQSPVASSTGEELDIATRQTAINKIFDLSLVEMKELNDKLAAIKGDIDPELAAMRDRFMDDLKLYVPAVEDRKKAINADGITLEAIQESAADFKEWRENVYDPETKLIVDLLFVLQGKQVLKTADVRYEKITADIKRLQIALGSGALVLKPYQTQALKELRTARSLETQAQDLLSAAFEDEMHASTSTATSSPMTSDDATGTVATTTRATTSEATLSGATAPAAAGNEAVAAQSVQDLMREAYGHVSQVYKLFLKMSKVASDLLNR